MRYLWIGLGWVSVGLGIAGAFIPLLPTTPFLLLAAFSFSRGSSRLHDWLINHHQLGPPIQHWHDHRAISRQVKVYASVSLLIVFAISLLFGVPAWVLATQAVVLTVVAGFLWTRNEPPSQTDTQDSIQPVD